MSKQSTLVYISDFVERKYLLKLISDVNSKYENTTIICQHPINTETIKDYYKINCYLLDDFCIKDGRKSGYKLAKYYYERILRTFEESNTFPGNGINRNNVDVLNIIAYEFQYKLSGYLHKFIAFEKIYKKFKPSQFYYFGNGDEYSFLKYWAKNKNIEIRALTYGQRWKYLKRSVHIIIHSFKSILRNLKNAFMYKISKNKNIATSSGKADVIYFNFANYYTEPIIPSLQECNSNGLKVNICNYFPFFDENYRKLDGFKISEFIEYWAYKDIVNKLSYIISTYIKLTYTYKNIILKSIGNKNIGEWIFYKFRNLVLLEGSNGLEISNMTSRLCRKTKTKMLIITYDYLAYSRAIIEGARLSNVKSCVLYTWGTPGIDEYYPSNTSAIITDSDFNKQTLIKRGYRKDRIVLAVNDHLSSFQDNKRVRENKYEIKKKYNMDPQKKIVFFPTQPFSEGIFLSDIFRSLDITFRTLLKMEECELLIKLHYKENDFKIYEYLKNKYKYIPKILQNDCDLKELLLISDIVIVICTNVGKQAIISGKDLIQYHEKNAIYLHPTNYYECGSAIRFSTDKELEEAIGLVLNDKNTRNDLKIGRYNYINKFQNYNNKRYRLSQVIKSELYN